MSYELFYYPYGSETATAYVHVEGSDPERLDEFGRRAETLLTEYGEMAGRARGQSDLIPADYEYHTRRDTSAPGRLVYALNGVEKQKELYLSEEDAIASVFFTCLRYGFCKSDNKKKKNKAAKFTEDCKDLDGLAVTFKYKDREYADIKSIGAVKGLLGISGVRFMIGTDRKNMSEYWLLTKTVMGEPEYDNNGIVQSPSYGIVKTGRTKYAGNRLCFTEYSPSCEPVAVAVQTDEDGNELYAGGKRERADTVRLVCAAHIFFESRENNHTFSVLINGRLVRKIAKRDRVSVCFFDTPLSFTDDAEEKLAVKFLYTGNDYGDYHNEEHTVFGDASLIKTENTLLHNPYIYERTNYRPEHGYEFYGLYIEKLYNAFECNTEKYITTRYGLSDGTDLKFVKFSERTKTRFATDDPPACQVKITRTADNTYTVDWGSVGITAEARACQHDGSVFAESFSVPIPEFSVKNVFLTEKEGVVTFSDSKGGLTVKVTNSNTGHTFETTLENLRSEQDFDGGNIPENVQMNESLNDTVNDLGLYLRTKDAIVRFLDKEHGELFDTDRLGDYIHDGMIKSSEEITDILYDKSKGLIPDENIIKEVARLYEQFSRTGQIPNIAIVGQAGTGKTTLAKALGRLFGREVQIITPSDLKGAFVGQTKYEVVKRIADAARNDRIVFVDEAYMLTDDEYGKEAISILLPLMSHDRTSIPPTGLGNNDRETIEIDFGDAQSGKEGRVTVGGNFPETYTFKPGIIPIWISGYENDVRKMISQNQGLYRRLEKLVIKTPTTGELLRQFDEELEKLTLSCGKNDSKTFYRARKLRKHLNKDDNKQSVKNFFGWGTQPHNSKYFASHAGVKKFLADCIDSIDFNERPGPQIEDIISAAKHDIKRQLAAVKTRGDEPETVDTINVITDIDTRFTDLVGCETQIAYMKSIIDMLVNKSVYEDNRLTVPKGALMIGSPGTGKTFIARAMAGELQERIQNEAADKRFGFMSFSASELCNMPANYIASIFSTAEEYDVCVLFIDEVDAIAKDRSSNKFYDRYMELIKQMDGIEKRSNVFVLAATNDPESLDPAFVRTGRIDKELVFELPEKEIRRELAKRALNKRRRTLVNFDPEKQREEVEEIAEMIAERTPSCTAGDIDNIINTAFYTYHQFKNINNADSAVSRDYFESYPFITCDKNGGLKIDLTKYRASGSKALRELYAFIDEEIERTYMGDLRRKKKEAGFNTDKNGNYSSIAVHEVGHALVSLMLGESFSSISVISREKALGHVAITESDMYTKTEFENAIRICMGGRVSEELIYGKDSISRGAELDLRRATNIAREMIEAYGFSEELGFMQFVGNGGKSYTCSEAFREKLDIAVRELLKRLYNDTVQMLSDKKNAITELAGCVFDRETVSGADFRRLYENELKPCEG